MKIKKNILRKCT